jgi:hypothetical protein
MTRSRGASAWLVIAIVWLVPVAPVVAASPADSSLIPLAVREGKCDCVLSTRRAEEKYLLILGTLSSRPGPYSVTVCAGPSTGPIFIPRSHSMPSKRWVRETRALRERLDRARKQLPGAAEYQASGPPRRERSFYLFAGTGDLQDPGKYVRVTGTLAARGRYCQVYVDREHADPAELQPSIAEVIRVFDNQVYPKARQNLGHVIDVDRDGRFTILFTPWLGKLNGGQVRWTASCAAAIFTGTWMFPSAIAAT